MFLVFYIKKFLPLKLVLINFLKMIDKEFQYKIIENLIFSNHF